MSDACGERAGRGDVGELPELLRERLAAYHPSRFGEDEAPKNFRPASVLVPLWEEAGQTRVLLTRRSQALPSHKGEISFPGGRRDAGESPLEAALREAREEVGLDPDGVEILGELDTVWSIGHYVVRPFVGWLPEAPRIVPDPGEIDEVLVLSLESLMDPAIHRVEELERGGHRWPIHFFAHPEATVWGLTGGLLHQLFTIVRGEQMSRRGHDILSLRRYVASLKGERGE